MAEVELGDEVNLSKGERKARKALAKHGLKPVSAITRVTIKKRNTLFVVATPAVYKLGADTYVVFGEVKVEDANQIAQQAQQWAQQDLAGDSEADAARLADDILDGAGAAAPDDGDEIPDLVDGADVEEKDVELVMSQANVSRAKALQALRANNNDIVNAIMELTLLIKKINKLQDAFASVSVNNPIDLPQIVVIGSQSSGKSSVLENIVGKDFLPRGSGIVTRRPLVLQLINRPNSRGEVGGVALPEGQQNIEQRQSVSSSNPNEIEEWGEFLHLPGQKFTDFSKIRQEIERETESKVGKNAGISPQPINLRIYSPNVLTLTMVDLPGLTRVPVGDQPKDIEKLIRDMIMKYITKSNAIILAVTAANTDLANSDGLKMARDVDPDGFRTIGVLTKIDLMDQGTDVVDILAGRVIALKLGYVPVVNRGQRDIDNKKKISAALEAEKNFFENHSSYRSRAQFCGTPFLARKLSTILLHHIKNTLPDIKARISQHLQKYEQELEQLGDPLGDDDSNNMNAILNIITEFTSEFRTAIDGTSSDIATDELSGGARISFVFHEIFTGAIRTMDPFADNLIKDGDIRIILYNSSGSSPALFVNTQAFEILVKQQIKRLEEPSLKCVTLVYDELVRILNKILQRPVFKRFPTLRERFYNVVIGFFKKSLVPTNKLVSDFVAMESNYINTGHPDFILGHKAAGIAQERIAARNAPLINQLLPPGQQKTGQQPLPPPRDPQLDLINQGRDEKGFFGGIFSAKKPTGGKPGVLESPPQVLKASAANMSERESLETETIKILITSYYNIVKRTVADVVPKSIMLNLVVRAKDDLQRELLAELYKKEVFEDGLKESDVTVERRKECKKMISALQKSDEIIASV
ncbi:vacuolar protein sorting-associated protein 1 [Physocladia obscura]|uniref:Nascent polypeptide-associated complex subunit beta n=1 Tax=Physocladia obscura TaxID=109957 RepID=A0AAD5TB44_9FUNG|nr:vacuolar protein sorting-associated protein 1 [Physocladia obscura]